MRYKVVFSMLFSFLIGTANANWSKINEVDYTWGPFNIYHITLFTEMGTYEAGIRPLMLTLKYKKPWAGRDFAVSLARTWKNLGIDLPEKEVDEVIGKLRKNFPDIKPEDTLHYIALEDSGYFILNDKVVSDVFTKDFNDAIVAIWLDPKMDISRQLLDPSYKPEPRPIVQQSDPNATEQTTALNVNSSNSEVSVSEEKKQVSQGEKTVDVTHTSTKSTEPEKQVEPKVEQKVTEVKIENPETFISPIYDDLQMLRK